jgi:hypothetical protein
MTYVQIPRSKSLEIGVKWDNVETYEPPVHQNDFVLFASRVFPISQGTAFLGLDPRFRFTLPKL